jgi:late competence protein required for DNA uptake (superfamily II DNA/RNA helicase)
MPNYIITDKKNMKCSHCHKEKVSVEERFSFGVYAGIFCRECCMRFRDHCGIDQDQGRASDLDERYWED